jgi:hypothetical protein
MRLGILSLLLAVPALSSCSTPKVSFNVDLVVTDQGIERLEKAPDLDPRPFGDLVDFYLSLPPPLPRVVRVPGTPETPNTPSTPAPPVLVDWGPFLNWVHAVPGGSAVKVQHLLPLVQPLVALIAIIPPSPTLNQFLSIANTPQAWGAYAAAQRVLQPLGLWNQASWTSLLNNAGTLRPILASLYAQLVASQQILPPIPGTPGLPATPGSITYIYTNPFEILQKVSEIWGRKDWREIASDLPRLVGVLVKPGGFWEPEIVLAGSRKNSYRAGVQVGRRDGGELEVHTLNEEGYRVNRHASGAGRYYQGPGDVSLTYMPIRVKKGRVTTLDVMASDRYALLKEASGGDVDLLSHTATFSTGLINLDLDFRGFHTRVVAGATPFASYGGVMGEVEYGARIFEGRIGGGGLYEEVFLSALDNYLGYLETENTLRTPYLQVVAEDDGRRGARGWLDVTLAASALGHMAAEDSTVFGLQGDIRVVPQAHLQITTEYMDFDLAGGLTLGVVPGGRGELLHPERFVSLYSLRSFVTAGWRLKVTEIALTWAQEEKEIEGGVGIKEWWTDEEKAEHLTKFRAERWSHEVYVGVDLAGEFSRVVRRGRLSGYLQVGEFVLGFLGEAETFVVEDFLDVRLGGRLEYMGAYLRGLKSLGGGFRIEAGIDVARLLWGADSGTSPPWFGPEARAT